MYETSRIYPSDRRAMGEADALLAAEGIRRDGNLDYTCGIYDESFRLIATGSCFKNTLRCLAVSSSHQGEGLLGTIVTHLIDVQYERGNTDIFIYTKCGTARFFQDLGFYEAARAEGEIVLMENRRDGLQECVGRFLRETEKARPKADGVISAIVMNANPFTLGHRFLAEKAAAESALLHIFVVSEEASLVPFPVRRRLVAEGLSHVKNAVLHDSGPYIISSATFPSYFQKDDDAVSRSHALLDAAIFGRIAKALGIARRYAGDEPLSHVTNIYNEVMRKELPKRGIECVIVPRLKTGESVISASSARALLKAGDFDALENLLPPETIKFFRSDEGAPVLEKIRSAKETAHY